MNLAMLKPGEKGKITKMGAMGPLKRRLMDMGVLIGEEIRVEKIAPLGDPIEVTIKNYNLSLRKKEAEGIAGGGGGMNAVVSSQESGTALRRRHRGRGIGCRKNDNQPA